MVALGFTSIGHIAQPNAPIAISTATYQIKYKKNNGLKRIYLN